MCRLFLLYWIPPSLFIANRDLFPDSTAICAAIWAGWWSIEVLCRWLVDVKYRDARRVSAGVDETYERQIAKLEHAKRRAEIRSRECDPDRVAHVKAVHDMFRRKKNEEARLLRAQIKKLQQPRKRK